MITTPSSIVLGGAFWTPEATVINGKEIFSVFVKSLFANGEQGFYYDPNDLSTMFQDAAGAVPVTAVGQPVGLIRDKSGRNNHARQTTSASRPILQKDAITGAYYLDFDGADDFLSAPKTNMKLLHNGSGASTFVGYTPLSSVYHTILNTGNLGNASVVGAAIAQDDRVGNGSIFNIVSNGSGTLHVNNVVSTGISNTSRVVTVKNITGSHIVRLNAIRMGLSSTEAGVASQNESTNDLWIGRAPAGFPMRGRIYSLIGVGRITTDSETAAIEKELAKRVGVTLNV
ncbi:hypothetical protein ACLDXX_04770 [Acinetobacter baumannii]